MFLVLFSLICLCYIYCDEAKRAPKFNEAHLTEQVHQSLRQVDKFLKNVQNKIRFEKVALRNALDQQPSPSGSIVNEEDQKTSSTQKPTSNFDYIDLLTTENNAYIDYGMTEMWWNGTPTAPSQIAAQTSFLPIPENHDYYLPPGAITHSAETETADPTYNPDHDGVIYPTLPPMYIPGAFPPDNNSTYPSPPTRDPLTSTYPGERLPGPGLWLGPGPYPPPHRPPVPTKDTSDEETTLTCGPPTVPIEQLPDIETPPTTFAIDVENIDATNHTGSPPGYDQEYEHTTTMSPDPDVPTQTLVSLLTTLHPNETQHAEQFDNYQTNNSKTQYEENYYNPTSSAPEDVDIIRSELNKSDILRAITFPTIDITPPTPSTSRTFRPIMETTRIVEHVNILQEDEHGVVTLGTVPNPDAIKTTIKPGGVVAVVPPNIDLASTVAGDVFHGLPKEPANDTYKYALYAEMDRDLTGYMHVFMVRMFHLVATKKSEDVRSVLRHAEPIISKWLNEGRIAYWGQPLLHVAKSIAVALAEGEIDVIQNYAAMMRIMMQNRKKTAAVDINSIIEYYDALYEEAEGELLFDALKEFDEYPNITKTSYELCFNIIDTFLWPIKRLYNSERRQRLLDSVNTALLSRFPNLPGFRRTGGASEQIIKGSRLLSTIRHTRYYKSNYPTAGSVRPHRRGRIIKRPNTEYENEKHSEFNYERVLRRNIFTPSVIQRRRTQKTTQIQKRFNIITSVMSRHFREQLPKHVVGTRPAPYANFKARPTTDYKLKRRVTAFRRYSNVPIKYFHQLKDISDRRKVKKHSLPTLRTAMQATNENLQSGTTTKSDYDRKDLYKKSDVRNDRNLQKYKRHNTFKHAIKESDEKLTINKNSKYDSNRSKKNKDTKLKTNSLRKIVDVSSYSDEEEDLIINLISAMYHGNRTFEMRAINDTISQPRTRDISDEIDEETESERRDQELSKSSASKSEVLWRTGYDDDSLNNDRDNDMQNQI